MSTLASAVSVVLATVEPLRPGPDGSVDFTTLSSAARVAYAK